MRANVEDIRARGVRLDAGQKYGNATVAAATGYVLDPGPATQPVQVPPVIFLNPAGAVSYRMPTSSEIRKGTVIIFVNLSGNIVTLQTDAGAGFTTALTVAANGATRTICTGNVSQVLGWVAW